jgi:hypothetical protein
MLTEANVEAHSFRLEFARELLQSMAKRKADRAEPADSAAAPHRQPPKPTAHKHATFYALSALPITREIRILNSTS